MPGRLSLRSYLDLAYLDIKAAAMSAMRTQEFNMQFLRWLIGGGEIFGFCSVERQVEVLPAVGTDHFHRNDAH